MAKKIGWFSLKGLLKPNRDDDYRRWAFPYGEAQREAVAALLASLFPGQDPVFTMGVYLNARDHYQGRFDEFPVERTSAEKLTIMAPEVLLQLKDPAELPLYAALVQADAAVDKSLCYPTAEQLRLQAAALDLPTH